MTSNKRPCPYKSLSDTAYWKRSVADLHVLDALDPVIATKFSISKDDKVATAGSCFAQHIARYLAKSGFNYYIAEPGHPILSEELKRRYNYGTFSARYANLYTTKQLRQLIERAAGIFKPEEEFWREGNGFIDPFRPHIQPGGFSTLEELRRDRESHLRAVSEMIRSMDVFVFTLGLTEAWRSKGDGAVFPLCPGCGAGEFEPSKYEFVNFGVDEVVADLKQTLRYLRDVNPTVKVVLTVSPVPLIATYSGAHVLPATTYSKSVLRVAAECIASSEEGVDYFPSYEIITGAYNRGAYFEPDLREVNETGVRHVMKVFMRHYLGVDIANETTSKPPSTATSVSNKAAAVVCDEERLLT